MELKCWKICITGRFLNRVLFVLLVRTWFKVVAATLSLAQDRATAVLIGILHCGVLADARARNSPF